MSDTPSAILLEVLDNEKVRLITHNPAGPACFCGWIWGWA